MSMRKFIVSVCVLTWAAAPAFAGDYTGPGSDWCDNANWGGSDPTGIINGSYTVVMQNCDDTINYLRMGGNGADVTIAAGRTLTTTAGSSGVGWFVGPSTLTIEGTFDASSHTGNLWISDAVNSGTNTLRIIGNAVVDVGGEILGARDDMVVIIGDNATVNVHANLLLPYYDFGQGTLHADLTICGNPTITVGSGFGFAGNSTFTATMSGGTLDINASSITHTSGTFEFSGGSIILNGNQVGYAAANSSWFIVTGLYAGTYTETYSGGRTTLSIPYNTPCPWACQQVLDIDPTSLTVFEDPSKGPQSEEFTVAILPDPGVESGQVVTIVVDPNGLGDGNLDVTVNPGTLTFTNSNWDTPQTVTVTAIGNDAVCDGGFQEQDLIKLRVSAVGGDPNDFSSACGDVPVTIIDYGCANIVISPTAVSVAEGGATDTYTIEVTTAPASPVTISVGAENLIPKSPTDPNLVVGPLPCQVTVNGSDQVDLVFDADNWQTPQTVTVAAIDDSLYEKNPHSYVIGNHVFTDDATYGAMSVPNVNVTIGENDARSWSFGASADLTNLLLPNPSFEDPNLPDGAKQVYAGNHTYMVPGFDLQAYEMTVWNPGMSDPNWLNRYNLGHRTVPDGEQILQTAGLTWNWMERMVPACTYLIEDGPVSYTYKMSVGVAKEDNGQGGYALHPDAWVYTNLEFNPPNQFILDKRLDYEDLLPYEGQWIEVEGCVELPAGHSYVGSELEVMVMGGHVDIDNLRVSVGNHPCPGCYVDITAVEGDLNDDCRVNLLDFAIMANKWLECNLYPECVTSW